MEQPVGRVDAPVERWRGEIPILFGVALSVWGRNNPRCYAASVRKMCL